MFRGATTSASTPERTFRKNQRDPAGGRALSQFIEASLKKAKHDPEGSLDAGPLGSRIRFAIGRRTDARWHASTHSTSRNCRGVLALQDRSGSNTGATSVRSSTSSASMRAISRPWRWRASSSRLRTICSVRRSAFRFRAGRTTASSTGCADPIGDSCRRRSSARLSCGDSANRTRHRARTVSLTLLDLSAGTELCARAELLALTLASAIGDPYTRERIAELFSRSQTAEGNRMSTWPICASTWCVRAATRSSSKRHGPWETS